MNLLINFAIPDPYVFREMAQGTARMLITNYFVPGAPAHNLKVGEIFSTEISSSSVDQGQNHRELMGLRENNRRTVASLIGRILQAKREHCSKSIEQVALFANISQGQWTDIEAGRIVPTDEQVSAIAKAVNATPEEAEKMKRDWARVRF